jgi:oxygen-independent coproporphyrinogen-3 oxidase
MATATIDFAEKEKRLRASPIDESVAVYLHVPFCHHRCSYCDFNIYAGMRSLYQPYAEAIAQEIAATASRAGRLHVPTIYLGGGTPSLFPAELIGGLLASVRAFFDVAPEAEITLEANPIVGSEAKPAAHFAQLRALGVNRLSLGLQSSHAHELRLLRRGHSFQDAADTFLSMREAGFDNLNIDLIYGLPGQALDEWRTTLERVLALEPEHLSAYGLQVEERTALFNWVRDGAVPRPDDDLAADMYALTEELLSAAGFRHYEISNWARDDARRDLRSQHNLVYWRNEPYLGFGCGAHSSFKQQRFSNVLHPGEYIRQVEASGAAVLDTEWIDRELEMGETLMLGLRLIEEGVGRSSFRDRFELDLDQVYGPIIDRLIVQGLLEANSDRLRLTPRGRLLGNRVFAEFLPDRS